MLPLGEPGWRNSTTSFCSERLAELSPRVWSSPEAVYALLFHSCNTFGDYSCTDPHSVGEALYRNDGTGWARIQETLTDWTLTDPPAIATNLVGLSTGKVALLGGECPVLMVDPQGGTECVLAGPAQAVAGAATADRLYVLVDDDASGTTRSLRELELSAGTWRTLLTLPPQDMGISVAANGDTVAISGLMMVGSASAGTLVPLPRVPAGSYSNLWVYGPSDIVATNGVGQIVRYDGTGWTVTDTGTSEPIAGLWGAPDGTIYFITASHFGRLRGQQIELFTTPEARQANHYFVDLWGNSSSEVFVTVNDRDYKSYQCGVTFLLWFDGATFHEF